MDTMLDLIQKRRWLAMEKAKQEIRACNCITQSFGLVLCEEEIQELVQCREEALQRTG